MTITPYPHWCESCKHPIDDVTLNPRIDSFLIYARYLTFSEKIGCSLTCKKKITHCFHASCLDKILINKKKCKCPFHDTSIITTKLIQNFPNYPITKVNVTTNGVFIKMRKTVLQGMADPFK